MGTSSAFVRDTLLTLGLCGKCSLGVSGKSKLCSALGFFLVGQYAVLAHSHAYPVLEAAVPAPEAVLIQSPESVCIEFNNFIQRNLGRLQVANSAGEVVPSGVLEYTEKRMCRDLPPLESSTYRVRWSVVGRDGHRTEGDYRFELR